MAGLVIATLRTRETPKQDRALKRVSLILNSAADLVGIHGPSDVSTTMIADHADIPVSSIYRYFSTVEEVLHELYLQSAGEQRTRLYAVFDDVDTYPTWQARLMGALEMQRGYIAQNSFYGPLLLHFMAKRGAVAVDDDEHPELVNFLEARWRAGLDGFQGGDPAVVANTTIQISLAMEDLMAAQEDADGTQSYSQEFLKVLGGYLGNYLSNRPRLPM